eukprot:4649543-Karenia_brevis.AAC.1
MPSIQFIEINNPCCCNQSQQSFAHFTPSSLRKGRLPLLSESSDSSSSSSEDLEADTKINADLAVLEEFMELEWFTPYHKTASTHF